MSTATKAAITAGTVGGGALGGAALGGAFSPKDKSHFATQEKGSNVPSPNPTNTPTSSPQTPIVKPSATDPSWSSLSAEKDKANDPYKGKIGETYGHLLTGTYGLNNNFNNDWWTKKFTEYNQDKSSSNNLSTEFENGKVTSPYAAKNAQNNDPTKALNLVCDSVYKRNKDDIIYDSSTAQTDNKVKLNKNLFKYCSNLDTAPKTIKDEQVKEITYENEAFGKTKETELMSIKDGINVALWKLKKNEFFALVSVKDAFFKALHDTKNDNPAEDSLKNKCKEAYTKKPPASGSASPSQDAVLNYCSAKEMTIST